MSGKRTTLGLLGAFGVGVLLATCSEPADAQPLCRPWPAMQAEALARYGQTVVSRGVLNAEAVLIVLASPSGETFTVVVVGVTGKACIVATGRGWDGAVAKGEAL